MITRPDAYSFDHTWIYEVDRRGVRWRATRGAPDGAAENRLVVLYPPVSSAFDPNEPDNIDRLCSVGEVQIPGQPPPVWLRTRCIEAMAEYEDLLGRLEVLNVVEHAPGWRRLTGVMRTPDGRGLAPETARTALRYAEQLGVSDTVPASIRERAAAEPIRPTHRDEPLQFRRIREQQQAFPR